MKTNKLFLAAMATSVIMTISMWSVSAFWGGHGQWGWHCGGQWGWALSQYVTDDEKAKIQWMSQEERQAYVQELKAKYNVTSSQRGGWKGQGQWQGQGQGKQWWYDGDPADLIAEIPSSDVSEVEKELLINQYWEEKMARDLYAYASEKYPNVNTFGNITKSEQKHMDTLQVLLDRYNIDAPSDYAKDNDLYVTLKNKIDISEKDAIEVWIMVETVDIDNITADIKATDNDDFKVILVNIGWASYNHLRGFANALDNNWYTTDIDISNYLTSEDLDSKGPIKVKLSEKLESEWVSLPEQASSDYIKESCKGHNDSDSSSSSHGSMWKWKSSHGNMTSSTRFRYNVRSTTVEKYKVAIADKYQSKIDALDNDKLQTVVDKIDTLLEKINTWNYSQATKNKYNATLIALKELILEKIEWDIDLDSVFN